MKKTFRKIVVFLLMLVMCFQVNGISSKAADVSITIGLSASSVSIGNSVTATVNVNGSGISAYTIYVTYDAGVLQYGSGGGSASVGGGNGTLTLSGSSAGSTSITFTAIANGSCVIATSGSELYNINLEALSVSHAGVTVTVATGDTPSGGNDNEPTTEADDRSANCNLSSLKVTPGTLTPAFSYSTTSYEVTVDEDVTSLVVSANAEDKDATVQITGNNNIEPGENTVKVIVTAPNGAAKVYNIRVIAGEAEETKTVTIDGKEYKIVSSFVGIEIPESFNPTTVTYDGSDISAYESPNKKVIIVCLSDEEDSYSWFIYFAASNSFAKYSEYSSNYNRYIIVDVPEGVTVPATFTPIELTINNNKVNAYWNETMLDIYLVYAINLSGDEGLYYYDEQEGTFLRYVSDGAFVPTETAGTVSDATPADTAPTVTEPTKDDGYFTRDMLILGLIIALLLVVILIITVIAIAGKLHKRKLELEDADAFISQLASAKDGIDHKLYNNSGIELPNTRQQDAVNDIINLDANPGAVAVAEEAPKPKNETIVKVLSPTEKVFIFNRADEPRISDMSEMNMKQQAYEESTRKAEHINDMLKENYDASRDSAFDD